MDLPLTIGLPLSIHQLERNEALVTFVNKLHLGVNIDYIRNFYDRTHTAVVERMKLTGGFCFPEFVIRGKPIMFAIDNIDFTEDTPFGQDTTHGTGVVVCQENDEKGTKINPPLEIPKNPEENDTTINYLSLEDVIPKAIKFDEVNIHNQDTLNDMLREYFQRNQTWAFACHLTDQSTADELEPAQTNQEEEIDSDQGTLEKSALMPTWAATNSLLLKDKGHEVKRMNTGVMPPLLLRSPTNLSTLYTALKFTENVSYYVVGAERKTIIVLDMDLYERATKIKSYLDAKNWLLIPGTLHYCFASLHALGKNIEGSGFDTCAIEAGIYSPASLRQIYTNPSRAFNRGVEHHLTMSLVILNMKFEAALDTNNNSVTEMCNKLKDFLNNRTEGCSAVFDELTSMIDNLPNTSRKDESSGIAKYLEQYLNQVEALLCLIASCRTGDLDALDQHQKK